MIYIILPVHNRKKITEKFIKCLLKQTVNDYKLILIDDGSTDKTDEMVLSYLPNTEVIYGNGNLWWAGALEYGYNWLKTNNVDDKDIVLLINDDTEFDDVFLENAVTILSNQQKTLVKAWSIDKYSQQRGDGYINADLDKLLFKETSKINEANCASTRGLFLRVEDFFKIGNFYPKNLPHYLSDYEFTVRAYKKGYKILCDNGLFLYSDSMMTGYHNIDYNSFSEFIKKYFSNRNPNNPIHWITFIKMTSNSKKYTYLNTTRIICSALKKILIALIFKKKAKRKISCHL